MYVWVVIRKVPHNPMVFTTEHAAQTWMNANDTATAMCKCRLHDWADTKG
jgi:hypothetical protein